MKLQVSALDHSRPPTDATRGFVSWRHSLRMHLAQTPRRAERTHPSVLASRTLAFVTLVSFCLPSFAQSFVTGNIDGYRCAVLGELRSCKASVPVPLVRVEERVELGPKALYLRYLGESTESAIAHARLSGEQPTRRVVQVTERVLSSSEAWDRANGRTVVPPYRIETTLSLTQEEEEVRPIPNARLQR